MARRVHQTPVAIYALQDPTGVSSRLYVGMTMDTRIRLKNHLNDAKGGRCLVHNWIRSIVARGAVPQLDVLETVPAGGDFEDAERFWIASFRAMGFSLANMTSGGEGLADVSPEIRTRIADSRRGKPLSAETRRKISEAHLGMRHRPESKVKMSLIQRGLLPPARKRKPNLPLPPS